MYKRIPVPLENSSVDGIIMAHVKMLAKAPNAKLTLIHVADGFQARHQNRLGESEEMRRDGLYLADCRKILRDEGFDANAILAWGDPAKRILEAADKEQCELIAVTTHGHSAIADLVFDRVVSEIHHRAKIRVLLLKA